MSHGFNVALHVVWIALLSYAAYEMSRLLGGVASPASGES